MRNGKRANKNDNLNKEKQQKTESMEAERKRVRKREREAGKGEKGETEIDKGAKILIVAGGRLIIPTVEMSRHNDYRSQELQITVFCNNTRSNNLESVKIPEHAASQLLDSAILKRLLMYSHPLIDFSF